jgi:UDP-3-O-[3-hydroxymyristoyl] glucosamine N-acyltransferase
MKLSQIASRLNAQLEGTDVDITGVSGIEHAADGHLTFISNPKYASQAATTNASALIVDDKFPAGQVPLLRAKNPRLAFARAIEIFYQAPKYSPGVHPTAVVHPLARIGTGAHIGPYVVIDQDVVIGDHAVLLAHAVVYRGANIGNRFFAHAHSVVREFCQIGDDVILQNGAIVGADGFGFEKDEQGHWMKIVQSGTVVLCDQVEVQANACVDRAGVGQTLIARNAKIDNLVQVGHGSTVGEETMLCAQVGLAGSTEVGRDVILAGQVGVAGHCKIGDGAIATAQSGIPNDVEAKTMVSGYPAIENRLWLRCVAVFNKLPELAKDIRAIKTKLGIESK